MTPHAKLLKEIGDYLATVPQCYDVAFNSHGFGRKGVPDRLVCFCGVFIGIEVKVGRDKPNPWQEREHKAIIAAGGRIIIARSLDQVKDWFNA